MSRFARDPNGRGRVDFDRLAQLFYSWLNSKGFHISECNAVRVYSYSALFYINVIDLFLDISLQLAFSYYLSWMERKIIYIFYLLPRPTWGAHIEKYGNYCFKKIWKFSIR